MKNKSKAHHSQITFEDKLFYLALGTGLLPSSFLFLTLYSYDISIYAKMILMFFMLISVFYCAFAIRHKIVIQFSTATNLMEAMSSGDHSIRARYQTADGALEGFNQMFNQLSETLAEQRLMSREKHILLHKVIAQIDVAIIAVDNRNQISLMNPNAEKLFACRFDEMHGWPIRSLGLQGVLNGEYSKVTEFEIKQYKKKVYIHTDEYFENGIQHKLIFITDIQHLLREEERLAWQKLLRVLSHEINNSLTPIASISETLSKLLLINSASNTIDEEMITDLSEGLAVITERSNSLKTFIQRYQQLSRLPAPDKTLFDLAKLLKTITLLFDHGNIEFDERQLTVYADQDQLQQVIVNLIKNAQQAMQDNAEGQISLSWQKQGYNIVIQVLDQGFGISNTDNIFVPFYTTKANGSGIGLVLSRQIIINHGGDLTIDNRGDQRGAKAIIYLPDCAAD
jgi:two-component system nitrogen regulation sensor histidine kinase NtrY